MDESKKPQNIADFLKEYHYLLTTLGVFTALAVFSGNLPYKWLSSILSFTFFGAMILVWFELRKKFYKTPSLSFLLFQELFKWGFLALVLYWLIAFRFIWNLALMFPLAILISLTIVTVLKKLNINEKMRKAFWKSIGILIFASSLSIATQIAVPINDLLDKICDISTKLDTGQIKIKIQ
jgi:hypothetical protein